MKPVLAGLAAALLLQAQADRPVPRSDENSRIAHQQLLAKATQGGIDVYFEGDSITRRWGATDYPQLLENWQRNFFGWNAADFGWGADRVENILWRLENGELDGVNPKVIVLLAGTNNVGNKVPAEGVEALAADVTRGLEAVVRVMRSKAPEAVIVVTAIFPRNDNPAVMPAIERINANLARMASGPRLRFLNVNGQLADRNGTLYEGMMNADKLHPALPGYQVWADALKPLLTELLGPPANQDHAPPPTGDPSARPSASANAPPHLEKRGAATQLIVDGKPFLALGGELYNNSATSLEYMKPIWPRLRAMHLNTVLAPVSWALLEPTEGGFDYTLVDGLIRDARAQNLRLVLLWFGSWKNTWSSYAPDWVKRDFERFPRVQLANGSGSERLSPLSETNRNADARAFAALMRRIREVDGDAHTVLMVQIENEVGVIPDARDHSAAANAAYQRPVPAELMQYLEAHKATLDTGLRDLWGAAGWKTSGAWETVFGARPETEDLFMAWHYAVYIGKVAEAGKAEYRLPMFANAALIRPSYAPGQYNSGGPLPHSIDIWRAGGPQLDFFAPDIYFEFKKWAARYDRPGNPLFIPEAVGEAQGAANVFYAIGNHNAFGFSPFAIDAGEDKDLARSYDLLAQLAPLILENQPKSRVAGVLLGDLTPSQKLRLGDYTLNVTPAGGRRPAAGAPPEPQTAATLRPHGIFIAARPEEFYMAGSALNITFTPNTPGPPIVGLATVEEGRFVDGRWVRGRTLAGDDTGQGNNITLRGGADAGILRVTVYRYR